MYQLRLKVVDGKVALEDALVLSATCVEKDGLVTIQYNLSMALKYVAIALEFIGMPEEQK